MVVAEAVMTGMGFEAGRGFGSGIGEEGEDLKPQTVVRAKGRWEEHPDGEIPYDFHFLGC
jgi:hypothetical protein